MKWVVIYFIDFPLNNNQKNKDMAELYSQSSILLNKQVLT